MYRLIFGVPATTAKRNELKYDKVVIVPSSGRTAEVRTGQFHSFSVSIDGSLLAVSRNTYSGEFDQYSVKVFDIRDGRCLHKLKKPLEEDDYVYPEVKFSEIATTDLFVTWKFAWLYGNGTGEWVLERYRLQTTPVEAINKISEMTCMYLPFGNWIRHKPQFSRSEEFFAVYEYGILAVASLTTMQHVWHAEFEKSLSEGQKLNMLEAYLDDIEPKDSMFQNLRFQLSSDGQTACCVVREHDSWVPLLIFSGGCRVLLEDFRWDTEPELAFLSDGRLICRRNNRLSVITTNPVELIHEIDIRTIFPELSTHKVHWRVSRNSKVMFFFSVGFPHVEVCAMQISDASIISRHPVESDGWPPRGDLLDIQITAP